MQSAFTKQTCLTLEKNLLYYQNFCVRILPLWILNLCLLLQNALQISNPDHFPHKNLFPPELTWVFHQVQFSCSVVSDSLWPHEPQHARPPYPSPTAGVHPNLCPLSRWHIWPCYSLLYPSPPALNLSQHQGLFKSVSSSHQVAKVLEFQLQHQSFQWTPRLISFRMDWLDLLSVQGTLESLLQHHSSKASVVRHSAFFIVQLSHLYMTTGKTIALTRRRPC